MQMKETETVQKKKLLLTRLQKEQLDKFTLQKEKDEKDINT